MNLKNYLDFEVSYQNDKSTMYPGFRETVFTDVVIRRDLGAMRCSDYGEDAISPRRRELCIVSDGRKFDQVSLFTNGFDKFLSMGMEFDDIGLTEVRVVL